MPDFLKGGQSDEDALKDIAGFMSRTAQPVQTDTPLLTEMATGVKRGLFTAVPEMVGGAMKAFTPVGSRPYVAGQGLQDDAKAIAQLPELQKSNTKRGITGDILVAGAEGVGQMVPVLAASVINPIAGAAAAGAMYGGSTYQDTKERMLKQEGIDDTFSANNPNDPRVRKAKQAGIATGFVQGAGDAAMTYLGGRFLKGAFPKFGTETAEGVVRNIASPAASTLKQFGKAWGTQVAGEGITEAGQDEAQAAIERAAGLKDAPAFMAQAAASAKGGIGTALLMGPLAGPGHYKAFRDAAQVQKALTDPAVDPAVRVKAAQIMGTEIAKVNEAAANNFLGHALNAIGDVEETGSAPYGLDLNNPALLQPYSPETAQINSDRSEDIPDFPPPAAGAAAASVLQDTNAQPAAPSGPPPGALVNALTAGGITSVSADMYSSFAVAPFAKAPAAQPMSTEPAPVDPAVIELGQAKAWASQQIQSGGNGHLMQGNRMSDANYGSYLVSEYRKSQDRALSGAEGKANGITDILPDVQNQGPLQMDGQRVAVPDLQKEVAGIGSDNRPSGGIASDLSNVSKEVNGPQKEVSNLRDKAVGRIAELQQEKESLLATSSGKGITGGLLYTPEVTRRLNEINTEIQQHEEYRKVAAVTPGGSPTPIDAQAHTAATSPANDIPHPTQAQIEAGNYKKGHVNVHGLDIAIENPAGSVRKGVDESGKAWETKIAHHYGYIKGTIGRDKDHIDVFIGRNEQSPRVFVVDQVDPKTGVLDEHKIMMGFDNLSAARSGYLANYDKSGSKRIGAITESSVDAFKQWLKSGNTKKAFAPAPVKPVVKPANTRRQLDTTKDSLIVAIAKLGGISRADIDKQTSTGRELAHTLNSLATKEGKAGMLHVISTKGKPLDRMREALVENGYLSEDAGINDLLEKLDSASRGTVQRSTHSTDVGEDSYRQAEIRYSEMINAMTDEEYDEFSRNQWLDEQVVELADAGDILDEYLAGFDEETMTAADWQEVENDLKEALDAETSDGLVEENKGPVQEDAEGEAESVSPNSESDAGGEDPAAAEKEPVGAALAAPASVASATSGPSASEKNKIEDFGEKIGGARKDYAAKFDHAKTLDIATEPFAKTWPEPDYIKLLADGFDEQHVSLVRALRDEIPDKPRKSWKLPPWVEMVKSLRHHAELALQGKSPSLYNTLKNTQFVNSVSQNIAGRAELYHAVGHDVSLRGITLSRHNWTVYRGEKDVTNWLVEKAQKATAFSNMPRELGVGSTKAEAIEDFKSKISALATDEKGKKVTAFIIYQYRAKDKPGHYIGKKVGKDYLDLQKFDDAKAAREYLNTHQAELEAQLAAMKDVPNERRSANNPRTGTDYRAGKDVTPEMFTQALGFRGVEFGNYVEGPKRQNDLNNAFDALNDLAALLNIPTQAISLNGELGLAFGARGHGGKNAAAAHYESDRVVINLTKNQGAGSLAHEWFHAFDSYLSRKRGYKGDFITDKTVKYGPTDETRQELIDAFIDLKKTLNDTNMKTRSRELDKTRSKDYWSTGIEMHARAFENYVIDKLTDSNASNDYLANINSVSDYAEALLQGFAAGKTVNDLYPYLLDSEKAAVVKAFDNLFATVKTKETDKGTALFALAPENDSDTIKADRINKIKEGNYVHERLPERYERAGNKGTLGAATSVSRGIHEAVRRREISGDSSWERHQRYKELATEVIKPQETQALRAWATQNNLIIDPAEFDRLWAEQGKKGGAEHQVYLSPDGTKVFKRNSLAFHETFLDYFHRLAVHNTEFSNSAYTLEGFIDRDGQMIPVVSQPVVRGRKATIEESHGEMIKSGYVPIGTAAAPISYHIPDTGLIVRDVHGDNTRVDANGIIYVVDPVIEHDIDTKSARLAEEAELDALPEPAVDEVVEFGDEIDAAVDKWDKSSTFKLADSPSPSIKASEAQALALSEAEAWVSTLPIAKRVNVVQSVNDLPAPARNEITKAKVNPARVKAMELHGDIFVIVDNVPDLRTVKALVIGHELAHAGQTEKIVDLAVDWFKRTVNGKTEQARTAHAELHRIADLYGYDLTNDKHFRRAVQEATAAIAEQVADGTLKPVGLMQRLFMYIKHWLRQNGLISHVSDSELSLAVAEMLRIGEKRLSVGKGGNDAMFAAAWHGGPHDFNSFDSSKIGTGEGAQAYGYGLYFAGSKEVAEHYRDQLSGNNKYAAITINGEPAGYFAKDAVAMRAINSVIDNGGDVPSAISYLKGKSADSPFGSLRELTGQAADFLAQNKVEMDKKGKLYQVELSPEESEYLLWDKPLSEQSEKVKSAIKAVHPEWFKEGWNQSGKVATDTDVIARIESASPAERESQGIMKSVPADSLTGQQVYFAARTGTLTGGRDDKASSEYLHSLGIRGIKYLDGTSRNRPVKDIKNAFLAELPEDAEFNEVMGLVGTGKFSPEQEALLTALDADDWLGFDYPAQAISAALGNNLRGFDPSQKLMDAVADLAKDQTFNYVIFNDADIEITAKFALADQAISIHTAKINAPAKVTDMVKSLIELAGQSIPPRLKANIGKILSNPWFGSEGNAIRRHVVDLNLERGQNRNGIISDLFQKSEGYTGVEGLDNILKKASKEELKQFNEIIKYGDQNDVAQTFTRDELYRGKTKFGKVGKTVVEAYKAFIEVMQAANRVRFEQLDQLSMLPYKDQEWYADLIGLLNKNQQRMAGLSGIEAGEFHRLVRSLKKDLTDEQLASGENPAKIKASPAVIAAYRDFWKQVDQSDDKHRGNMLSAFRDILGYRGELDKLKNEWGVLKGYAPRNRKDGDYHVSVYKIDRSLSGAEGEGGRVKVYMKPTLTETGAKGLVREVQADLKKHLKGNFEEGTQYEVEYERNNATPSELLAWKGSEVAVEALLNQAFDRAGVTGKMSVEEWQSLKNEVFQQISKEIMAQGFGRHGISREATLIEGYDDTDYQTVLKEYISGMSGWLSKMRFAIETTSAAKDISKADPSDKVWVNDYVQDAMKNSTYMDELAATARSVGAVYYLGFKVSSAILNAFQNYTVGQAELSLMMKKSGLKGSAVAALAKAQKDVLKDWAIRARGGKGTLTEEEHDVLFRAVREGTAQAQAIRQISGTQEMGFGTGWKKFTELSMTPFQFVEQRLNREPGILAAYRIFKKSAPGEFDAAAYKQAELLVNNTHYVMGKENLPEMVRKLGPIGKTVYLFQGYVHNYLHWMYNRARDGEFATIARSLGAIAALGGVFALPGADDLEKWIMKWFGVSYKMKFKKFVHDNAGTSAPGKMIEDFVNHGVTSVAGVDMSRALAVSIPFISDPEKTFGERIGGAWGGLLSKPGMALSAAQKGDYVRAVENLLPEFAANPMRAARQYNQGATTLSGKPIFDETGHQVKYSGSDVGKKMFGFNPLEISDRNSMKSNERDLNAYWKSERDDVMANIRRAKTPDDIKAAVRAVMQFNIELRKSQAFGLVPIIKADSIEKSRTFKPQKKTLMWERKQP